MLSLFKLLHKKLQSQYMCVYRLKCYRLLSFFTIPIPFIERKEKEVSIKILRCKYCHNFQDGESITINKLKRTLIKNKCLFI